MAASVEGLKKNQEKMYGPWMKVSYGKSRNGSGYLGRKNFNGQNGRADNGARPVVLMGEWKMGLDLVVALGKTLTLIARI
ncbi:hypothetical protein ACOSQ3_006686 [Xanthoceras sorbifolium]